MASSNEDNPEKESSMWFTVTMIGVVLYATAAIGFVALQDVEPTDDQIEVPSHD